MADSAAQQADRRRRWRAWLAVAGGAVVAGGWATGLLLFIGLIPRAVSEPDLHTDGIVILTGGSERLDVGLRLLLENKAERLLVSGVPERINAEHLLLDGRQLPRELACCIDAGHAALNTAGNAVETAAWVRRHGFRSLRVVTANYHMPRSLLELRHSLPETRLVSHPVFPPHVRIAGWWRWPGTTVLLVSEYTKFLASFVRQTVGQPAQPAEAS
jgi:uncharacterized SAM-binding protein YcdF (DUF218 family)